MSLKNLIVKGKFFQYSTDNADLDDQINHYNKIKSVIRNYLSSSGFDDVSSDQFTYNYANLEFFSHIPRPDNSEKKPFFSFLHKNNEEKNYYLDRLGKTKDGAVWHVSISSYPTDLHNKKIIFVEITSEPAIIHKYQQLHYRPSLTQDDIDLIIYENQEFISRLASGVFLNQYEMPKPLGSFVKTEITVKLRAFNFEKVAELLEKGRNEIEIGKTENGLVDLRSALELFFVQIIEKRNGTASNQDKIKQNINELKNLGIIDEAMTKLLVAFLVQGAYSNLSETTHSRDSVDLFDARLYFDVIEKIFEYLLEKGVKYNINKKIQSPR